MSSWEEKARSGEKQLHGADLRGADLHCVDLTGATLYQADLSGANLCGAVLRGADLRRASLPAASLRLANLQCADLSRTDLYRGNLCGASLRGANLTDAHLNFATLHRADLRDASLNWDSHELISAVLMQEAGHNTAKRAVAGLIRVSYDWCWEQFLALYVPEWEWAIEVLSKCATEKSPLPPELEEALGNQSSQ